MIEKFSLIDSDHPIFLISDKEAFEIPQGPFDHENLILARTEFALLVSTLHPADGETFVFLVDLEGLRNLKDSVVRYFSGSVRAPSRELVFELSDLTVVKTITVPEEEVRLEIWANHPSQPDQVVVVIDAESK